MCAYMLSVFSTCVCVCVWVGVRVSRCKNGYLMDRGVGVGVGVGVCVWVRGEGVEPRGHQAIKGQGTILDN